MEAVNRIKSLIEEGRYPIDLAKIARKMVELDLPPQRGNS
jgi:anti-sigma28 factor (negative regulator of flagellin synthesis)